MSSVFLYIYLTFIPPSEDMVRTIEDKIHVDAECVDLSNWLKPGESLGIDIEELENVRG